MFTTQIRYFQFKGNVISGQNELTTQKGLRHTILIIVRDITQPIFLSHGIYCLIKVKCAQSKWFVFIRSTFFCIWLFYVQVEECGQLEYSEQCKPWDSSRHSNEDRSKCTVCEVCERGEVCVCVKCKRLEIWKARDIKGVWEVCEMCVWG